MTVSRRSLLLGGLTAGASFVAAGTAAAGTGQVISHVPVYQQRPVNGAVYNGANRIWTYTRSHSVRYGLYSGHDASPGPSGGYISCSGLTRWVFASALGYDYFGRYAYNIQQFQNSGGQAVPSSFAMVGDLVFYNYRPGDRGYNASLDSSINDHVAVYMGGGTVMQAFRYPGYNGVYKNSIGFLGSRYTIKRFYA